MPPISASAATQMPAKAADAANTETAVPERNSRRVRRTAEMNHGRLTAGSQSRMENASPVNGADGRCPPRMSSTMSSNAQSQMAAAIVVMSKQVNDSQSVVFMVYVELRGCFSGSRSREMGRDACSATRPEGGVDGKWSARAGFAEGHGRGLHGLSTIGGPFHFGEIDFAHIPNRRQGASRTLLVGACDQFQQSGWRHLPRDAPAVF